MATPTDRMPIIEDHGSMLSQYRIMKEAIDLEEMTEELFVNGLVEMEKRAQNYTARSNSSANGAFGLVVRRLIRRYNNMPNPS